MHTTVDFSITPIGTEVSTSKYVAACHKVIQDAGLKSHLHAHGTNIEGDWDNVMSVVKRCQEKVHSMGAVRVKTNLTIETRTDRRQSGQDMIDSVQQKIGQAHAA